MSPSHQRLIPVLAWGVVCMVGLLFWSWVIKELYPYAVWLYHNAPWKYIILCAVIAVIIIDPLHKAWRK